MLNHCRLVNGREWDKASTFIFLFQHTIQGQLRPNDAVSFEGDKNCLCRMGITLGAWHDRMYPYGYQFFFAINHLLSCLCRPSTGLPLASSISIHETNKTAPHPFHFTNNPIVNSSVTVVNYEDEEVSGECDEG
jgi:hypothetical protein